MKPSDRQSILAEISQAEQQLASLRSEQRKVESTLQSLKARLQHNVDEHNSESYRSRKNAATVKAPRLFPSTNG